MTNNTQFSEFGWPLKGEPSGSTFVKFDIFSSPISRAIIIEIEMYKLNVFCGEISSITIAQLTKFRLEQTKSKRTI